MNEDREGRGVEKEAVPSRRESMSSGWETVGSLSGSCLSLRSQLSLSTMSEEYLNKGALDVLLVAVCSIMMLSAAFQNWYVHVGIIKYCLIIKSGVALFFFSLSLCLCLSLFLSLSSSVLFYIALLI